MEWDFERLLAETAQKRLNVCQDSRKAGSGDIFVVISGNNSDGADYLADALARDVAFVVAPAAVLQGRDLPGNVTAVPHEAPRRALWQLAAARYGTMQSPMRIIGITGTNGKTTISYLLEHLFASCGHKAGVMGTVSYRWPGKSISAPLTTPDSLTIHSLLAEMREDGVDTVIMEVSSHALDQERVGGIPFSAAIFTNLTQDHLDYHKDIDSYFNIKSRLFLDLPKKEKYCVINADDPYGSLLLQKCQSAIAYGTKVDGRENFLAVDVLGHGPQGSNLRFFNREAEWEIHSRLVGRFNISNLMAAQAAALGLGLRPQDLEALESFPGVPGRLEKVDNARGLHVFVDYAHTPDALQNVLLALREVGFARIVTVFGCGGNRDRTKRPLMGEAVSRYSDVAIVTSDNPRFEDPEAIIADIMPGMVKAGECHVEADRRKATGLALSLLGPDDALLIAGKGHEDYQIINDVKHHYSDQETVRELLS